MKKPLIIIAGPTASGKTGLALELAKRLDGEVVSADSMQVYRGMDIGTAKISPAGMEGIPHHLIDICSPGDPFNIRIFQEEAKKALASCWERGKVPLLTGGTGFYIQSVLYDIDFETVDKREEIRQYYEDVLAREGAVHLHRLLEEVDPEGAQAIHPNNVKRVVRALEYHAETGTPISAHNKAQRAKASPYNFLFYVLTMDRQRLYGRIDRRVDRMFEEGLVAEVRGLAAEGYGAGLPSMQGLGYKEVLRALEGKCSLEEAKTLIQRDTRHFAKRQLTWFRREPEVDWIRWEDYGDDIQRILDKILKDVEEKQLLYYNETIHD
ncbi:tRNA (adenosine(37)-N6)-dimethylallyltransferase MiaA [Anaerotalea alkaliphila]|uniref:tRNA dimethylallyltransferase n=1 Tax=Anaerotalea alkaliphila TaxID=2662126 RepID=A0A7X5KPI4_9FIRM|nr:tRNA (adenosine(37)-N6)-dimethylallyltransferase MiaA [Anaerotalea alkaliphila]NDL68162.1 tRNA (adenosine(37)-N6)-dimethylallyltransferase MiaA [Anaerotalea alkaliphila]